MREDFADAWSRYTPHVSATTQHSDSELESADNGLLVTANVADIKPPEMPQFELDVAEVADTGGCKRMTTDSIIKQLHDLG